MRLNSQLTGDILILRVEAERLDAASAVYFKDQFREAVQAHEGRVVVDLEPVSFMDSSGLGAMVAARKLVADRELEIAELSPIVMKVFRLTRMDKVFSLHDRIEDAIDTSSQSSVKTA